jgi:hypothetical protein
MLWVLLGGVALFVFLGGLRAFERANVRTIKSFVAWVCALGGISLAMMLIMTGRGGIAIAALTLFGPLLWDQWQAARGRPVRRMGAKPPPARGGPMSREEAYQVLGLQPGAAEAEIRAAHKRLMRAAHPDGGGSDWLAARVNQARDVLLNLHARG